MYFIGFSRGTGFNSRVVKKILDTEWYHAWIAYEDERWGRTMVAHATSAGGGVITEPIEKLEKRYPEAIHYMVKPDLGPGLHAAGKNIGAQYDLRSVCINLALLGIYRVTGKTLFTPVRDESKYNCSEFVIDVLKKSGIREVQELDSKMTKVDILESILSTSDCFERTEHICSAAASCQ